VAFPGEAFSRIASSLSFSRIGQSEHPTPTLNFMARKGILFRDRHQLSLEKGGAARKSNELVKMIIFDGGSS
jgi:hypothetical protein